MVLHPVERAVREGGLFPPAARVVALLSGGRDSVCLVHVLAGLLGAGRAVALHVNYGLRTAADEDERHCARLCSELGVALELERAGPAPAPGNLQAWARDVRYAAAARLAGADDALIATGHTATDQAETILYRLAASPGRRALLGMPASEGRLVRPLLTVTREQTADYCRAHGLAWREDETNVSDRFARGRAREGLVPALRELHPAAEANVVRTAELLRDEAAVLDELVAQVLEDRGEIELTRLRALPVGLRRLIVRRLAEDAVGGLVGRASSRADDVLAMGDDAALDLGEGARARTVGGVLRFERTPAPEAGHRDA